MTRRREGVDVYRLDRNAYHLLAEGGAFDGSRVELLDGLVVKRGASRRSRDRAETHFMLPALRDASFEVHRIDRAGYYSSPPSSMTGSGCVPACRSLCRDTPSPNPTSRSSAMRP